uniref:Uncharacterized protein n=2 Tax=Bursaphelenchus xylophilus TaxID=6326 RepID=A0A1I7SPP6_BURXY
MAETFTNDLDNME